MTLIDYLNRVHFADGILEEALWAELDTRSSQKFMVLAAENALRGGIGDRMRSGLPKNTRLVMQPVKGGIPTETEARTLAAHFKDEGCDAFLVYGRGYVINLAKAVRLLVAHDLPLSRFAEDEGGSLNIARNMPDLIAVPCLQGFVSGFNGLLSVILENGSMVDIAGRSNVPTVTIADPTISASDSVAVQSGACVEAVTLCIEALLSPNYNPPANGMAMDGLRRGLHAMASVSERAGMDTTRELMAAGMNAALVQQKGLGLTYAISASLCAVARGAVDKGTVKRLLLPQVLAYYARNDALARSPLMEAMGLTNPDDVCKTLSRILKELPMAASLSELRVTTGHLDACCARAARHRAIANTPCRPATKDIRRILAAVY